VEASRDAARFATYLAEVTRGDHRAYLARLGVRRLLGLRSDPHFGYHLHLTDQGWRP
jgi:hypothetical protein